MRKKSEFLLENVFDSDERRATTATAIFCCYGDRCPPYWPRHFSNNIVSPRLLEMEHTESKKQQTRSLVNSYEVTLLEETQWKEPKNTDPTEEKIQICFQTLDEMIPKLGIFQKVIKALRDDLFDSVYSHQYTTKSQQDKAQALFRIPYFTLIKRVFDQRDEKADELRDEINSLKKVNEEKETIINEKDAEIENLKKTAKEMNKRYEELEAKLQMEKINVASLESSLDNLEKTTADLKRTNERKISDLKIELQSSFEDSKALRIYKNGYDKLQDAFEDPGSTKGTAFATKGDDDIAKRQFVNPRLEQVAKDIAIMDTLESQLYYVRNCVIQEHDDYMESKNAKFCSLGHPSSIIKHIEVEKVDSEIERESRELATKQSIFTKSITDIKEELSLLMQQRELLDAELNRLKADDAKEKEIWKKKAERSKKDKNTDSANTLEEVDLVEIMAGKTDDPFIPHENILSKYSAMIYTSCNDGKTFYEMPDISYCESCAVKTLMCPHSVTERERIFEMPKNCTHIKITRPEIRIKRKRTRKKTQAGQIIGQENTLLPRMSLVWEDFQRRTTVQRKAETSLSEDYIISIINQFYSLLIWQDEYQPLEDDSSSILNSFYDFLFDRYLLEDVVFLSAHDILKAVEKLAGINRQIHLFAACLDGSIDAATCRYVLLMNEFIESFKWSEMNDFSSFISIIYPFLQEEDLEQLRMGYTAFSENKIAGYLVHDYLLYIILTEKEPRFLEMEVKLLQCPVRDPGHFTDIEFIEAMDSIVPFASERLIARFYSQSRKHFADSDDTVSARRISHITSYLTLIQNTPKINNDIKKWKSEKQHLSQISNDVRNNSNARRTSKTYTSLYTLSKLKIMGAEMARLAKSRKLQQEEQKIALGAYEI